MQFTDDGLKVEALKGQASYIVSSLLEANCWVVLAESGELVKSGDVVSVYL